jgi:class 3 adenylate cyclase
VNPPEPYDFARQAAEAVQALAAHRQAGDLPRLTRDLVRLGNLATNQADYASALDYLHEADDLAAQLHDSGLARLVVGQMGVVLSQLGDHQAALECARRELALAEADGNTQDRMLALNALGCSLGEVGRHDEALRALGQAHAMVPQLAALSGRQRHHFLAQSFADQSSACLAAGRAPEARAHALAGLAIARESANAPLEQLNVRYAGRAALALGEPETARGELEHSLALARRLGLPPQEARTQLELSEACEQLGQHREALAALREGMRIDREFRRDEAGRRLEFRKSRQLVQAAEREAENAEKVLFAVLPAPIARRVRAGESRIAEELPEVSVLFADLVGFTAMSRTVPPAELLARLDALFTQFDALTAQAGLEKVKTIGDAYMAAGGALGGAADHLERCVRLAQSMIEAAPGHALRIGIHVGPAVAGIIGTERLSYDLWGDTVNLAARLESSGVPGRIHVGEAVAARLAGRFAFEPRGTTELKGIGPVATFLVAG